MRKREAQALGGELADVGALDVLGLLELDDAEDLDMVSTELGAHFPAGEVKHTWMDRKRDR